MMPLTSDFYDIIKAVDRNWSMGVELVSPLIYYLIRSTHPRSLLEVGAGYSTPFILQALADNMAEYEENKKLLQGHVRSDRHVGLRRLLRGRHPLPLASPEYYQSEYCPVLSVIDDSSHPATSAGLVEELARRLNLSHLLQFHDGDFRGMSRRFRKELLPFDLVWFDCGGITDFLAEYWQLVNPHGGFLLLHSAISNPYKRSVLLDLKRQQATDRATRFEMLSVVEPHKWQQNSLTILRMTSPDLEKGYPTETP
jgi:hypothetical protein